MSPTNILDLPDEVLGAVLAQLAPSELPYVKQHWSSPWSPVWTRLLRTHAAAFGPLSDVHRYSFYCNFFYPQTSLARSALVCRRFHRLVIPLLYHSPILRDRMCRQFIAAVGDPRDARLASLVSGRDHIEFVIPLVYPTITEEAMRFQDVLADVPRLRIDIVNPRDSPATEETAQDDDSSFRVAVRIKQTGRVIVSGPRSLHKRPYEALERASYVAIGDCAHKHRSIRAAPEAPELNLAVPPNHLTRLQQLYVCGDALRLGVALAVILAAAPRLTLAVFAYMDYTQWRAAWPFPWYETQQLIPQQIAQVPAHVPTLQALAANLVPRMDWLLLFPRIAHLNLQAHSINVPQRNPDDAALDLAEAAQYAIDCALWISAMIPRYEHVSLVAVLQLCSDCKKTKRVPEIRRHFSGINLPPPFAVFETRHDDGQPLGRLSSVNTDAEFVDRDAEFGCHTAASVMAVLCHPRCRPQLETFICEGTVLGQFDLFRLLDCQPRLVELRAGQALLKEPPMYRPLRPALNLTTLSLVDCPIRTDATLSLLVRSCPALQTLSLCVWFTDQRGDGLAAVARLQPLRQLEVHVILVERPLPSFNAADSQLACFWRSLAPAAGRLRRCGVRVCVQYATVPELAIAMWPAREMRKFLFACTQAHFYLDVFIRLADPSPLHFCYRRRTTDAYPRRLPFQFRDQDGHFMVSQHLNDTLTLVLHSLFSARSLPRAQHSARAWLQQNAVVSADGVSIAISSDASIGGCSLGVLYGKHVRSEHNRRYYRPSDMRRYLRPADIGRHPVSLTLADICPHNPHPIYPWLAFKGPAMCWYSPAPMCHPVRRRRRR